MVAPAWSVKSCRVISAPLHSHVVSEELQSLGQAFFESGGGRGTKQQIGQVQNQRIT